MAEKQNFSKSTMLITIMVAIVLCALIWPLSLKGKGGAPVNNTDDAELRIQPVAKVEMQMVVVKSDGKPRDGAAVYAAVCMACHGSGVAGAPKAGDKAAWASRIATGTAALIKSVTAGKGAMPPKGGGADLTDAEIKAAVVHLTGLSN
jgi:cytochrome c5